MVKITCSAETHGQLLFVSEPYVHVLSPHQRGRRCEWCFGEKQDNFVYDTDDGLLPRCQGCQVARYCNVSCQKHAWKLHKLECKCLKNVSPHIPSESVRMMLKILVRQSSKDDTNKREVLPGGKSRTFSDLQSHLNDIKEDSARRAEFTQMCQVLKQFTGGEMTLPEPAALIEIFGRLTINSFSICDEDNRSVGVGLYLAASALNHSCNPNAVAVFRGTQVFIRAVDVNRCVPKNDHEVTISYVDLLATKQERQSQLDRYYFTCNCMICTDPSHDAMLLSSCCPVSSCAGKVTMTTRSNELSDEYSCTKCNTEFIDSAYLDNRESMLQEVSNFVHKQESVTHENSAYVIEKSVPLLKKAVPILGDNNVYVVRVLDTCFDACIMLEQWSKAVLYGERTLPAYRQMLPRYHPNFGIQLLRVAKLKLFLGQFQDAMQGLQEAEVILEVTHGKDHFLLRTLEHYLMQCRMEADRNARSINA